MYICLKLKEMLAIYYIIILLKKIINNFFFFFFFIILLLPLLLLLFKMCPYIKIIQNNKGTDFFYFSTKNSLYTWPKKIYKSFSWINTRSFNFRNRYNLKIKYLHKNKIMIIMIIISALLLLMPKKVF